MADTFDLRFKDEIDVERNKPFWKAESGRFLKLHKIIAGAADENVVAFSDHLYECVTRHDALTVMQCVSDCEIFMSFPTEEFFDAASKHVPLEVTKFCGYPQVSIAKAPMTFCGDLDCDLDELRKQVIYLALLSLPDCVVKKTYKDLVYKHSKVTEVAIHDFVNSDAMRAVAPIDITSTVIIDGGELIKATDVYVTPTMFEKVEMPRIDTTQFELIVGAHDVFLRHKGSGVKLVRGAKGVSFDKLIIALCMANAHVEIYWLIKYFHQVGFGYCDLCRTVFWHTLHTCVDERLIPDVCKDWQHGKSNTIQLIKICAGFIPEVVVDLTNLSYKAIFVKDIAIVSRFLFVDRFSGDDYTALAAATWICDDVKFVANLSALVRARMNMLGVAIPHGWVRRYRKIDLSFFSFVVVWVKDRDKLKTERLIGSSKNISTN
jgi:hypothetical protein